MSARLSVIFYIILCLEIGVALTVAPWWPQGMWGFGDWGNNYFLLYAASKTGIQGLQAVVASGWVRGAVSGVGLLNLGIAFWEIFHFKQTVTKLQNETATRPKVKSDVAQPSTPGSVRDHAGRDEQSNNS
jgi:hypothetical protein